MKLVGRVVLWLLLCVAPAWAGAQSCDFRTRVALAGGDVVCLTQYTLGQQSPTTFSQPLHQLLPNHGNYAVAAPRPDGAQCPLVVGLNVEPYGMHAQSQDSAIYRRRTGTALANCQAGVDRMAPGKDCKCELVVVDGRSRLTRNQFDRRYLPGGPPADREPAPVAKAAEPPPDPAQDEAVLALQKRLAELEAALPETPPVAAAPPAVASAPGVQAPRLSARALVIGNSRYASFGALANPRRDATAIAAKLRGFGIEVDLVLDAQRDDLIHALNEHSRKASGRDVSILYYAGHGVQVEGTNYIIPVNMRADGITAGYVKLAGISLAAAMDYLPAKTRIVFLDACRDNPATRSLLGTRGGTAGLAPMNVASGTLLSYATRDGATADDGAGLNSPYTTALLKHLDQPQDISLVLRQVRQTVLQLTGGRQEPWEYGSLVGEQIVLPLMAR